MPPEPGPIEPTPNRPPRRLLPRRLGLLMLIALGALALALVIAVWMRDSIDPARSPEALLPGDTAALLDCRDLAGLLDRLAALPPLAEAAREEWWTALLLGGAEATQRLEKEAGEYRFLKGPAGALARRWLGRRVLLALVPPPEEAPAPGHSGLLLILQTEIGFEEKSAELFLTLYPDARREQVTRRGERVYCYRSESARHGFAYCRLGDTLLLSLRSADPYWIDRLLARRAARLGAAPGLDRSPWYRAALEARPQPPASLRLLAHPPALARALRQLPARDAGTPRWNFWIDEWERLAAEAEYLDLSFSATPDEARAAPLTRLEARLEGPRLQRLPGAAPDFLLPGQLGRLSLTAPSLPIALRGLVLRMSRSGPETYAGKLDDFEREFREKTGSDFRRDWLEGASGRAELRWLGEQGVERLPLPQARAVMECVDTGSADRLARALNEGDGPQGVAYVAPLGQIATRAQGPHLIAVLNPRPGPADPILTGQAAAQGLRLALDGARAADFLGRWLDAAALLRAIEEKDLRRWRERLRRLHGFERLALAVRWDDAGGALLIELQAAR